MNRTELIEIHSTEFWVKLLENMQQNWALIELSETGTKIYFINDLGGVFDDIPCQSVDDAIVKLKRNGFFRYTDEPNLPLTHVPPSRPFHIGKHPNGKIYSSGRYWR